MRKIISIDGMHCEHCSTAVAEALQALPGVQNIQVSLPDKQAVLEAGSNSDESLRNAIEDIGFDVISIS